MARNLMFTKTWSPIESKLIAIRIDFSKPKNKRITQIHESDWRYKKCMASKTTFAGFVKPRTR